MLIRSQNKAVLLNFSNWAAIYTVKDEDDFILSSLEGENECALGKYSTKAKALKVLDMIHEAYAEYKITCTFLTGFTGHRAIVESNGVNVSGFEELVKNFKKDMVFQMPEDSEVVA